MLETRKQIALPFMRNISLKEFWCPLELMLLINQHNHFILLNTDQEMQKQNKTNSMSSTK